MKVRAFVRVSEHNSVKKIIDKFRNEYPDWESNLPKLIQSLGKKKKKVKATDVDDNVDSEVVSGEESDHDSEDDDDDEDAVQENDDADESDTKKVIDSNDNESVSDQEMKSENASNDDSDEDKGDDDLFVASLKQAISSNKRMDSKNSKAKPLKKQIKESSEGEAVIKMLDLSSMNKDQDWSVTPKEQSLEAPLVSKRSSFFMGGQSESEDEDNDVQSDEESDGDEVEKRIESLRNSNHHSQSERRKSSSRHQDFKRQNYKRDQNGGKRKPFQKVTSVKKPKFNKNTDRQDYERSHGTNDINSQRNKSCQNSATMDQLHSAKTKSSGNKTNFNSDSKVHPSWEAKQKQKPSIQAFQGK